MIISVPDIVKSVYTTSMNMKKFLLATSLALAASLTPQAKDLHDLQQEFVDLKCGLFVHFGMGTFQEEDWADPDDSPLNFNPQKLDCNQWADAAQQAGMSFGCISVKHHCGFCMWDTETTPYSVMNSGIKRDVLREFVDALRARDMKVMYHFSILDLHEKILPRHIKPEDTDLIKAQLRELLTNYGPITALMIDGWDAPWARISYDDISFEDIYKFVKSIQPDCLVMDLNGAKYPADALFYSDIKAYEQGAGQRIDSSTAWLPSMACDKIQPTWFWKTRFPGLELNKAEDIVNNDILPKNSAGCTFILNVAPNRDGLFDENALQRLAEIGQIWKNDRRGVEIEQAPAPIIATNLAKNRHATGSWSWDAMIHDFANDDDFSSCWYSNESVESPWWTVELGDPTPFNTVAITDNRNLTLSSYAIDYRDTEGNWNEIFSGDSPTNKQVKVHTFPSVTGDALRVRVLSSSGPVAIAEVGVYNQSL